MKQKKALDQKTVINEELRKKIKEFIKLHTLRLLYSEITGDTLTIDEEIEKDMLYEHSEFIHEIINQRSNNGKRKNNESFASCHL